MWNWIEKASELQRTARPFALVTVIEAKGSTPRDAGAKMLVLPDGTFFGTIGGGRLEELVLDDARKALRAAVSEPRKYPLCFRTNQCCGGAVEVLIEVLGVGPLLYVFGAGHVGTALCQTMSGTPFTVHAIDTRAQWVQSRDLPDSTCRHLGDYASFADQAMWDTQRVYAVVMTHEHDLDLAIINDLIKRPTRFIGLIGSETKWQRFQQRLKALGADPDMIGRVHCPVGMPLGGKAPREVAISIAAQLLQVHYHTSMGSPVSASWGPDAPAPVL